MEVIVRTTTSNDWITGIFLLSLLLLVLAREIFDNRFTTFTSLVFSNKYVVTFNKIGRFSVGFNLLMSVFQLLNFGLFFYIAFHLLGPNFVHIKRINYSSIILGLMAFYVFKICIQLLTGYIFNIHKFIRTYLIQKWTYLNFSAFAIFLLNLLLAYAAPESKTLIFLGLGLITTVNLIGWFTLINSNLKFLTTHFFYFILYLCSLEIAPLVIVPYVLNA
ncbi:MAG: hypothetical protein RLZZ241_1482 [Bacteroidota bacterium]